MHACKIPSADILLLTPSLAGTGMSIMTCRFHFILKVLFFLMPIMMVSCHMNYGRDVEAKKLLEDVPDTVMENSHVDTVRDNVLSMTLSFERAEVFNTAGKRIMTGVVFVQYDRDGTIIAQGTAAKAVQSIQTDDVQFSGGLHVEIESEKASIDAENLEWRTQTKSLVGQPGQTVKITRTDGSTFQGSGFVADFINRTMELSGGVQGSLVHE